MNITKKRKVRLALKINFYVVILLLTYHLLQIMILKGNLFVIERFLNFLFYVNCIIVGVKIFKKQN